MTALTTDALVEAMAKVLCCRGECEATKAPPVCAGCCAYSWKGDARAALAALVEALGLTKTQLEDTAYWIEESTSYLEGAEIEGFKSPDPVASLLRALAGAAEGGT